ncbi:hypothetical protein AK812_SmicGene29907 [Symbiodinium microadriaticum]|uniref:Uncharacterized protein n=1 Tax=Symbiodinium microadriaticum TaxID=2951 RepID=A0A1Q9D0M8_SYMMI|nr:hypothetical protein AK812_SmicGene29907 [Symbiodinium microadriaticum]
MWCALVSPLFREFASDLDAQTVLEDDGAGFVVETPMSQRAEGAGIGCKSDEIDYPEPSEADFFFDCSKDQGARLAVASLSFVRPKNVSLETSTQSFVLEGRDARNMFCLVGSSNMARDAVIEGCALQLRQDAERMQRNMEAQMEDDQETIQHTKVVWGGLMGH